MGQQNNRKIIPIFFAVDDFYSDYLCVTLQSLIENSSSKYDYMIYVLIDELSEENKRILLSMQQSNVKIEFASVTEKLRKICEKLHMRDYYTKATYYRFFIPELFPQYDKGLYLDCDIVMTVDIAELYNTELGDNYIAAIPEEFITDVEVFGIYSEKVLGVPRQENYSDESKERDKGQYVSLVRLALDEIDEKEREQEIFDNAMLFAVN